MTTVSFKVSSINGLSTRFSTNWLSRRANMVELMTERLRSSVYLLQEFSEVMRDYVRSNMPGGKERWLVWVRGEQAIMFDSTKWEHSTATKVSVVSSSYHGAIIAPLKHKATGQIVYFCSGHLSPNKHASDATQKAQLLAIARELDAKAGTKPRILGGDLNDPQAPGWIPAFTNARLKATTRTRSEYQTVGSYGPGTKKYDHLLSKNLTWPTFITNSGSGATDHHIVSGTASVNLPDTT